VIVSQLLESDSRNEKAKAVGYVFGMGRRIKGQIDETHRAVWEGDYWKGVSYWFASSEDITLQGENYALLGCRRIIRTTCNSTRLVELRYVERASSQYPANGGDRRLQDKEIATISSGFPSCLRGNCSRR
jgi:hypothetical protein